MGGVPALPPPHMPPSLHAPSQAQAHAQAHAGAGAAVAAGALDAVQQRSLVEQLMRLPAEQVDALPASERAQVMQLRQTMRWEG